MGIFIHIGFMIIILVIPVTFFGFSRKHSSIPFNWPVVGMLPGLVPHFHRLHDKSVEILQNSGGTFQILPKNSWFFNVDILLTSDPANVQHIMSANFSGYPKGVEWRKRFDIFGDSVFNFDFGKWRHHRAIFRGFLNHQRLQELMPKIFEDGMEKILIPSLERVSEQDVPVALQDLLGEHIFYMSCRMITGCDLCSFQISSHESLFSKAIGDACEAIAYRHLAPESTWKFRKWLGIGKEKRLSGAWIALDHLFSEYISIKREELSSTTRKEDINFSLLELILTKDKLVAPLSVSDKSVSDKVIRDNLLSFMFAAHDTTSTALNWFFWILSKHPDVEKRIREEIQQYVPKNGERKWLAFGAKELNKTVYLHAALCETLRLYPPVPFQSRTPLQNDKLPSGHNISPRTTVVISTYAMGRMRSIWGEDCEEFKPERWITDDGGIKYEASHKFFAFNAGPRICLGKDIGFTLMKAIASAVIHNYDVQVVKKRQIRPKLSIILHMSQGLMVKVKKRWAA